MRTRRISSFGVSAIFHVAALVAAIWLEEGRPQIALTPSEEPTPDPVVVLVESLPPGSSLDTDLRAQSLGIQIDDDAASVSLPGFTFDFSKVVKRASVLFPFLTGTPMLERVIAPARNASRNRLPNPLAQTPDAAPRPPLDIADSALQSVIDKAWSRRDRWRLFGPVAALANAHSPNQGRVPALLSAYVAQNGLQPYIDASTRDPRLWVELGLASDHADFIDFVSRFAIRNPSTRATTELLFLLDKLAEASLDALLTLVDSDPIPDLGWTRQTNPAAFNAVVAIRNYYKNVLHRMGLVSADDVRGFYDRARIAILSGIVRTTPRGYRASDARFLLGAICWRQRDTMGAVRWWRELTSDPTDAYFAAYSEIEGALRSQSPPDSIFVNRVLQAEHGRWITFSAERLHQFGFHFDTF